MTAGHRWNTVGDDFQKIIMAEYRAGNTVHWPTAIAATACLAGEAALMANETRIPERGAFESKKVAEFMHDGPVRARTLWGYTATVANKAYGIDTDVLPEYRQVVLQLGMHLQSGSFPALDVPLHLTPHDTPMNAGPRLRREIHESARVQGVQGTDTAFSLMTAAMKMVGSAQAVGPRDLITMALQCCVAGSRFAPLVEISSNDASYATLAEPEVVQAALDTPAAKAPVEESTLSASALVAAMLGDDAGAAATAR